MKKKLLGVNLLVLGSLSSVACAQTVFNYTGTDQTYVVPDGMYGLVISMWGAGGGTSGGGGGYVSGLLPVAPGQVLTIVVGGSAGGVYYNEGVAGHMYGGGGYAWGFSDVLAGNGGGRSAIRFGSSDLVTAGAGGGGTQVTIGAHFRQGGGGGGGLVGGSPEYGGGATGGTQTAGGSVNGAQYQGGDPSGPGAGGGGGYFGGGGGSGSNQSQYFIRAGAGGSSYIANLENGITESGSVGNAGNAAPGGITDPFYTQGIGIGGAPVVGVRGGHGQVVIRATTVPEPSSLLALSLFGLAGMKRLRRRS